MVARVRRLAGQRRVGHAGTLDPLARGVLPVLLGRATRLADAVQRGDKTYVAVVALGAATDTDDAEGQIVATEPVPVLSPELLEATLGRFRGTIDQRPPRYSAVKVAGQRAYAVARRGEEVDLAPRPVTIHELHRVAWAARELTLEVTCSKGTYVRALARDIAADLGTVGHLTSLVRTRVGQFVLADAVTLDDVGERGVAACLLSPSRALPDAPSYLASAEDVARLRNGQPIVYCQRADAVWVYDPTDRVICLASADGTLLHPRLIL